MVKRLKKFGKYTIDALLREFREIYFSNNKIVIKFIPFKSKKGKYLLKLMMDKKD